MSGPDHEICGEVFVYNEEWEKLLTEIRDSLKPSIITKLEAKQQERREFVKAYVVAVEAAILSKVKENEPQPSFQNVPTWALEVWDTIDSQLTELEMKESDDSKEKESGE